jgi:hypothetical protein
MTGEGGLFTGRDNPPKYFFDYKQDEGKIIRKENLQRL